jgi:hypothetical protein
MAGVTKFRLRLKLAACAHCGRSEQLNAHGPLHGYSDLGALRQVRGHRFYCSNRGKRTGCGRTFSLLYSHLLYRRVATTVMLWKLTGSVIARMSLRATWRALSPAPWSLRTGYRLWKRLDRAQVHLRTTLLRLGQPPPCEDTRPMIQLLNHLAQLAAQNTDEAASDGARGDPFSWFQETTQLDLLGNFQV